MSVQHDHYFKGCGAFCENAPERAAERRSQSISAARIAREIAAELREHGERWWPGFRAGKRGAVSECLGWHIQEHGGDAETLKVFGFDSVEAVMAWNDRADVTIDDVIALCDDVASQSDEQQNTGEQR